MAVLNGIRAIGLYLGVSNNTVLKYIKEFNLPIRKLSNSSNASVMSTSELLDRWVEKVLINPDDKVQIKK